MKNVTSKHILTFFLPSQQTERTRFTHNTTHAVLSASQWSQWVRGSCEL